MNCLGLENDFRKQSLSKISLKMTSKMECFDQASFCFENRAQDAPKARQGAPRCPKTPQNSSKITPRRPEDAPRNRPGRLQEAPRRPKTHPRRRKTPARRPKTPPRWDFGGFREPNWNQVGRPRAAQTHPDRHFE